MMTRMEFLARHAGAHIGDPAEAIRRNLPLILHITREAEGRRARAVAVCSTRAFMLGAVGTEAGLYRVYLLTDEPLSFSPDSAAAFGVAACDAFAAASKHARIMNGRLALTDQPLAERLVYELDVLGRDQLFALADRLKATPDEVAEALAALDIAERVQMVNPNSFIVRLTDLELVRRARAGGAETTRQIIDRTGLPFDAVEELVARLDREAPGAEP